MCRRFSLYWHTSKIRPTSLTLVRRVNQSVLRVQQSIPKVQCPAPRVQTTLPTNHCRPRVGTRRMAPINEERRMYPLGTTIWKKFNKFNHIRKIIKYNEDKEWYSIEYQDCDWEEMSAKEVSKYQCSVDMSAINNVRRLTRSFRAAALSVFKSINNNDVIITPDRIIPKGCVNAVFDEETKTMMVVKVLINHKNPATWKI